MFPIIGDDRMWDSESGDDVSLDEVHALRLGDRGEWFCSYPLGEIIDRHNGEFGLCPSGGEWTNQVYSPSCKLPGADERREPMRRLSWDMGKSLAFVRLLNKLH